MKKSIRLSVIASLLMGSGVVLATSMSDDRKSVTTPVTRLYTVSVDSSLYQLALQSGISVAELRAMNKGLDRRERLQAGQSLLLPVNSPLFPLEKKRGSDRQ